MKRWKLIKILADEIYHDPYAGTQNREWDWVPTIVKENYLKIKPVLLQWQEKDYITLVEDDEIIYIVHIEKLPTKEQLMV